MMQVLYPGLPSIFLFLINNSNYSHHLLRGYNLPGTCLLIALAHLVPQTPTDGLSVCAFHMGKLSPRTAVLARANRSGSQPRGSANQSRSQPGGPQTGAEVSPGVRKPEPKSARGGPQTGAEVSPGGPQTGAEVILGGRPLPHGSAGA